MSRFEEFAINLINHHAQSDDMDLVSMCEAISRGGAAAILGELSYYLQTTTIYTKFEIELLRMAVDERFAPDESPDWDNDNSISSSEENQATLVWWAFTVIANRIWEEAEGEA